MKKTRESAALQGGFWKGTLLLFLLLTAARTASVVLSFLATDVRYAETLWTTALNGAKQFLTVFAFGAGIALLSGMAREGKRPLWQSVGAASALFFLDDAASFAIDAISGAVGKELLPLAGMYCAVNWLFHTVLLLFIAVAADRGWRKNQKPVRLLLSGALIYMGGRLFLETIYLVQFLVEVDFLPYAREILSIALAYGDILLLYGGGGFISALLIFVWLFGEKGKKAQKLW